MNQEAKFQLGLRERELMLHAVEKEQVAQKSGQSAPRPVEESQQTIRATTTRELIVASLLEQAKSLMVEVNETRTQDKLTPRDACFDLSLSLDPFLMTCLTKHLRKRTPRYRFKITGAVLHARMEWSWPR